MMWIVDEAGRPRPFMRGPLLRCRWAAIMLVSFVAVGCGGQAPVVQQPTAPTVVELVGGLDQNPNAGGRPSPVEVDVLLLSDVAPFKDASYEALTNDRSTVLGASRLAERRIRLRPGDRSTIELAGVSATHLAVLVDYAAPNASCRASARLQPAERATGVPAAIVLVERAGVRIMSGANSTVALPDFQTGGC